MPASCRHPGPGAASRSSRHRIGAAGPWPRCRRGLQRSERNRRPFPGPRPDRRGGGSPIRVDHGDPGWTLFVTEPAVLRASRLASLGQPPPARACRCRDSRPGPGRYDGLVRPKPFVQLSQGHAEGNRRWETGANLTPDRGLGTAERPAIGLLDVDDGRPSPHRPSGFVGRSDADE